jgi:transposase
MAYSMDLRTRVLADSDAGLGTRMVATKYRVSESWVRRLKQRRRENGEVAPRQRTPPPPKWLSHAERLQELVQEQPDATLAEIRIRSGSIMSISTVSRALRKLNFTFKKKSCVRPNRTDRTCKSVVLLGSSK